MSGDAELSLQTRVRYIGIVRTVEYRVSNQPTRIDSLRCARRILNLRHRLTIPILQIRRTPLIALQLVRIITLHISPVVLIEVREFVVQEHGRLDVVWDLELDDALLLLADVCLGRIVEEGILWCGGGLLVGLGGTESVVVMRNGDGVVRDGVLKICGTPADGITLCVVDGDFCDLKA